MSDKIENAYPYGCIMAKIDSNISETILKFNRQIIKEDIIYTEEPGFGREIEPHITIKYGFIEYYSDDQIKHMIRNITPFYVKIKGISTFESNPKYDVVKLDIDSPRLHRLNSYFSSLPHEDSFPTYIPHMTLAYVKKGFGNKFIKPASRLAKIPINSFTYSHNGNKRIFYLNGNGSF